MPKRTSQQFAKGVPVWIEEWLDEAFAGPTHCETLKNIFKLATSIHKTKMTIAGLMIPKEKVVTVTPNTPVEEAMKLVLDNKIGSLVVIEQQKQASVPKSMPVGIITKTDVVQAYQSGIPTNDPCKSIMCKGPLHTCTTRMGRDKAARIMEAERTHHLIVVDEKDSSFVGLLSTFDIATDCAQGGWPWPLFGGKSNNEEIRAAASSQSNEEENRPNASNHGYPSIVHHKHDDLTYADTLDVLQFQ